MAESLDFYRFAAYLRARWRWIAGSSAVAMALVAAVSYTMPRQYTATARIVIEPPAGSDPRSTMAVSPIYFESLKTYEQFAGGDSLFQKAVDHFQLRQAMGGKPIEGFKKRVLKVGVVRNTRILEISATLPDARQAQSLAQYVAESAVALNQTLANEGDQDLLQGIVQQEREIRTNLDRMEASWAKLLSEEPIADLQSALSKSAEVRQSLQQQILATEQEIADTTERLKNATGGEAADARKEASNATARLSEMHKQLDALAADSTDRERLLAIRMTHRDNLEAERKSAQTALAGIEARAREARTESGSHAERLRVIDPGVVPERPSSPNLPLNVMAALLLGLALPVVYLTLELNYRERSAAVRRSAFQAGAPRNVA